MRVSVRARREAGPNRLLKHSPMISFLSPAVLAGLRACPERSRRESPMLFYQLLSTRQLEMCEIGNGPMILQRVGDNRQQLAGGGYNGFAGSAPPPHAFLKPVPEGAYRLAIRAHG